MLTLLRRRVFVLALLAVGAFLGGGCDHPETPVPAATPPDQTAAGLYRVRLRPETPPILMNAIHNWVAHVETAAGAELEAPELRFDGGMPQHGHGFVTTPRVTKQLGPKEHLIEGVKFHMAGDWVLQLDVRGSEGADTIRIPIRVDP